MRQTWDFVAMTHATKQQNRRAKVSRKTREQKNLAPKFCTMKLFVAQGVGENAANDHLFGAKMWNAYVLRDDFFVTQVRAKDMVNEHRFGVKVSNAFAR